MILYIIKYTSLKKSAEFLFAVMQRPLTGEREEINVCTWSVLDGMPLRASSPLKFRENHGKVCVGDERNAVKYSPLSMTYLLRPWTHRNWGCLSKTYLRVSQAKSQQDWGRSFWHFMSSLGGKGTFIWLWNLVSFPCSHGCLPPPTHTYEQQ